MALELLEGLELKTKELVQPQVSDSQRVGLKFPLKHYHMVTVAYSILTLLVLYSILTMELMTPQESLPQKPLHNLHAPSPGDDQCEHNAVGDQLSPGR